MMKSKKMLRIISLCLILLLTNSLTIFAGDFNFVSKETNIKKDELVRYYNKGKLSEYPQKYLDEGIDIENFIDVTISSSEKYKINHEIIFKDIMNRTGYLNQKPKDQIEYYNFSGIRNKNEELIKFNSIEQGIEANIQLLLKYIGKDIQEELIIEEINTWINNKEYITDIEKLEEEDMENISVIEETTEKQNIVKEKIDINEKIEYIEESVKDDNIPVTENIGTQIKSNDTINQNNIIKKLINSKITNLKGVGTKSINQKHKITAEGISENGLLYQFWIKDLRSNRWIMIKDYSTDKTATWTPKKIGDYLYGVHVKDKLSKNRLDTHLYQSIKIGLTKSTTLSSLEVNGSKVIETPHNISAEGISKSGVLYQFWIKDLKSNRWIMIKDYSTDKTATWIPKKTGDYLYGIHIKDKYSKQKLDTHLYKNIKIESLPPAELNSLEVNGSKIIETPHNISAEGISRNGVLYQFWIKDLQANTWTMIKDYSTDKTAIWSPKKTGDYLYGVHVKDKYSKQKLDTHLYKNIKIESLPPAKLNKLETSGSKIVETPQHISAEGTSQNGVLYQYWVKDLKVNRWKMIKDYSTDKSAPWTPKKTGDYLYGVHIRDKHSKEKLDTHLYKDIKIESLPPAELLELNINELDESSSYRISAAGTSTNGVLYQFWVKDLEKNLWTMIKDYSEGNVVMWTPEKATNYLYGVHIKDKKSKNKLDTHLYKEIRVNTIINYSDSKHSLEEALNIQMRKNPQTDYNGGGWKTAKKDDVRNLIDPKIFSKARLDGIKVKVDPLNFRTTPEIKNGNIITRLWKNETYVLLKKSNGWYKILARGRIGWVHNSCVEEITVTNDQIFQFLDLSKPSGVKVEDVSKLLYNKGNLSNQAKTFIEAGRIHNINEVYLISHALHETGNGHTSWVKGVPVDSKGRIFDSKTMNLVNSKGNFIDSAGNLIRGVDKRLIDSKGRLIDSKGRLINQEGYLLNSGGNPTSSKTNFSYIGKAPYKAEGKITIVYNMFGIGAYDRDPLKCGAEKAFYEGWTSVEKAIIGGAKFVSEYYVNNPKGRQNTLYKMRWNPETPGSHQYATDIGWAYKQIHNIKRLYDSCNGYTLYLDIPRYREL